MHVVSYLNFMTCSFLNRPKLFVSICMVSQKTIPSFNVAFLASTQACNKAPCQLLCRKIKINMWNYTSLYYLCRFQTHLT